MKNQLELWRAQSLLNGAIIALITKLLQFLKYKLYIAISTMKNELQLTKLLLLNKLQIICIIRRNCLLLGWPFRMVFSNAKHSPKHHPKSGTSMLEVCTFRIAIIPLVLAIIPLVLALGCYLALLNAFLLALLNTILKYSLFVILKCSLFALLNFILKYVL